MLFQLIDKISKVDPVFRRGEEISPFFKIFRNQIDDVFFEGIDNSPVLKYKDEFEEIKKKKTSFDNELQQYVRTCLVRIRNKEKNLDPV